MAFLRMFRNRFKVTGHGYIGVTRSQEMISSPLWLTKDFDKGAIVMSIDRFIIKKLDSCHEEQTRLNLVKLFKLRIQKAEREENRNRRTS
ncbi:hypothetical protein D3C73_1127770 [compost metagenome]